MAFSSNAPGGGFSGSAGGGSGLSNAQLFSVGSSLVGGIQAVGGALVGAYAAKTQAEYARANAAFQQAQAEINARYAEMQAEEVVLRGDKEASEYQKKVSKVVGSQRAALAAQGIEVDSGTAVDLQQEAAETGALDVQTIKNNAWRQAFGYKQEAIQSRFQGRIAAITGTQQVSQARFAERQSLVTGGLNLINQGVRGIRDFREVS